MVKKIRIVLSQILRFTFSPIHTEILPIRTTFEQTYSKLIRQAMGYQVTCQLLISAPLNKNTP